MTKSELARRMLTITHADFLCMVRHVRAGEGPTMVKGNLHTLKQANAAYAWVERYGMINPTADQCAPDDAPAAPVDTDPNAKLRIFEITLGEKGTESRVRVRVYLLNPGETFVGFGGSRYGLTVRQTASLIVSTLNCGSTSDVEYDLRGGTNHPAVWRWIKKLIAREAVHSHFHDGQ